VQWMQMVLLRKLVQFRTRGVGDLIPRHILRIALLVGKCDHRIGLLGKGEFPSDSADLFFRG
jgi:hypothetical protein